MSGPDIIKRLSKDSEIYFAFIATSHLMVVIMFQVARVGFLAPVFKFQAR